MILDFLYAYDHHDQNILFNKLNEWQILRIPIIQQKDLCSCGLIAIIFVILLTFRVKLNELTSNPIKIKNDMMSTMRIKLATTILSGKLYFSKEYLNRFHSCLSPKLTSLYNENINLKIIPLETIISESTNG